MTFLIISFIAGVLTVLAPCILPLLPVVIGSSASGRSKATPYIVVGSLALSVILFTYLLKASTVFIMVPQYFWTYLSGGIIVFFGITLLAPTVWEHIPGLSKISIGSNKVLGKGFLRKSFWGDVLVGASLGPIFSTCSPTYFVILASVLPASFILGSLYLLSYTIGLSIVLLLVAVLGERFTTKLNGVSDSRGWFKRILGILFILLGLAIMFGLEKKLETHILNSGYFDVTKIENRLLEKVDSDTASQNSKNVEEVDSSGAPSNNDSDDTVNVPSDSNPELESPKKTTEVTKPKATNAKKYVEIVNPSGFVNSGDQPFTIGQYVGKKVILLDVMTYSCINCQRTFPYVTSWYEKYKDDGLIVIGIHTPEFAFEKNKANVEAAMKKFGINFPVVMDNDYGTWNALGNRYWPRKYLIDINGNIVYDHIGEGGYEETETKIKELLMERSDVLKETATVRTSDALVASTIPEPILSANSPETYLGSARNEYFANGVELTEGKQTLHAPSAFSKNVFYLDGSWNFFPEYAMTQTDAKIVYRYNAKEVYLVMDADQTTDVEVWQDGALITQDQAGEDVDTSGVIHVKESRLYKIVRNLTPGEHVLELRIKGSGLRAYAFTFG